MAVFASADVIVIVVVIVIHNGAGGSAGDRGWYLLGVRNWRKLVVMRR